MVRPIPDVGHSVQQVPEVPNWSPTSSHRGWERASTSALWWACGGDTGAAREEEGTLLEAAMLSLRWTSFSYSQSTPKPAWRWG